MEEGFFFWLSKLASPDGSELRHQGDLGIHLADAFLEIGELAALIGGDDVLPSIGNAVGRGPGFTTSVTGDGLPRLAIERDLHLVLRRGGPAHFTFIRATFTTCIDENDALKGFGLGKSEGEYGGLADKPRLARGAIDSVLRTVGLGEVLSGG